MKTDLSSFDNRDFCPGGLFRRTLWFFINALFFQNPAFVFQGPKRLFLRAFGAKLGKGVVIKPSSSFKYPWLLEIGDYTWVGEKVWIDNLCRVKIGSNVCLSQGCMLLTGNHNYKKESFDLITGEIILEDGVWIGAQSVVCPGVYCDSHSILAVASVASQNLEKDWIYRGNPAQKVRLRW